jgi:hypothetical protein
MYALAADCSIGSAGSAILMTHSRSAQGEPALIDRNVRRERMICIRGHWSTTRLALQTVNARYDIGYRPPCLPSAILCSINVTMLYYDA